MERLRAISDDCRLRRAGARVCRAKHETHRGFHDNRSPVPRLCERGCSRTLHVSPTARSTESHMTFLRLLRAWLIIVPVMIANGALRELVLERWVVAMVAEIL